MIWVFLFYILPFILDCIILYVIEKREKGSVAGYIEGCLMCLIPILNIVWLFLGIIDLITHSNIWKRLDNIKL